MSGASDAAAALKKRLDPLILKHYVMRDRTADIFAELDEVTDPIEVLKLLALLTTNLEQLERSCKMLIDECRAAITGGNHEIKAQSRSA